MIITQYFNTCTILHDFLLLNGLCNVHNIYLCIYHFIDKIQCIQQDLSGYNQHYSIYEQKFFKKGVNVYFI